MNSTFKPSLLHVYFTLFATTLLLCSPASAGIKEDLLNAKKSIFGGSNNTQPQQNTIQFSQPSQTQKQTVIKIQRDLTALGYKPGPVDGAFGNGTKTALEQFQFDFGHKVTGVPDNTAVAQLNQAMGLSSSEQKLRQQTSSYRIVTDSMLSGCAVAAGAKAAFDIFSGDKDDILSKKTLAACGIGAAGGLIAGLIVQDRVKAYKEEEATLDDLIGNARQENAEMSRSIRTANDVIAADRAKIAAIKSKLDSGQITKKEANAQLASVDNNTEYLKKTIKGMKKSSKEWNKLADEVRKDDPQKAAQIETERAELNKKIETLETTVKDLVHQRKVSVG